MATTSSTPALVARALVKSYPGGRGHPVITALDGLSLHVETGRVIGLLGPNGAGKTTTVKILATLSRADSGSASVAGIDVRRHPDQVRRAIGFVAQKPVSDPMDTGAENLELAGRLHGMSADGARARAAELLRRFSLEADARRLVKSYSGGMARKLDVAIGLMHRPQVLFLDEPTTGLDPQARAELWAEIERLADHEQMTVLLTTHYLDEADHLAHQIAIIDHGRIVAEGSPEELKSELHGDAVIVEVLTAAELPGALAAIQRVHPLREVTADGLTIRARADHGATALPLALAALDQAQVRVASATISRPSLDDVYLAHTGRSPARGQQEPSLVRSERSTS